MKRVYFKDSFTVLIRLLYCSGEPADIPSCDWSARIFTPASTRYVSISQRAGVAQGWRTAPDGRLLVPIDGGGLQAGPLCAEFMFHVPDDMMPDKVRELRRTYDLGVMLTQDQWSCMPTIAEAEALMPFIKGESMSWEGMTADERKELAAAVAGSDELTRLLEGMLQGGTGAGDDMSADEAQGIVDDIFGSGGNGSGECDCGCGCDGDDCPEPLGFDEARGMVDEIFG